jgi:hypothetical protein
MKEGRADLKFDAHMRILNEIESVTEASISKALTLKLVVHDITSAWADGYHGDRYSLIDSHATFLFFHDAHKRWRVISFCVINRVEFINISAWAIMRDKHLGNVATYVAAV